MGTRIPRWPAVIPKGYENKTVSGFVDIVPTLADIAGIMMPKLSGQSILATLKTGESTPREAPLYWEFSHRHGAQAVVMGRWKLIRRDIKAEGGPVIELFDLEADEGEATNLAVQYPDLVREGLEVMAGRTPTNVEKWEFPAPKPETIE